MIIRKSTLSKGLPKNTESICPLCKKIISARIYAENEKVMIEKNCPSCKETFKDIYWSDVKMYLFAEKWAYDGVGVENPFVKNAKVCPYDCGLCDLHLSHTVLANIDLTNRCNLKCPICFANAASAGYVYEPSYETIIKMLKNLRAERPVPCTAVQFSGGEPTLHPDFLKIIAAADELGFAQVQIATNGLKFAHEKEFAANAAKAGLDTIYLQFDTLDDDIYIKSRGRPLVEIKEKALENIRCVKPKPPTVVLVPTIVNGLNDGEVGAILEFAIKNRDIIKAVNYQPVSFSGRIEPAELSTGRFTLPDLVDRLVKQTNYFRKEDFYPVPAVAPISELISLVAKTPKVAFTPHPHCGLATYIFVEDGNVIPITRFVDVAGFIGEVERLAKKVKSPLAQLAISLAKLLKSKKGRQKSVLKFFDTHFSKYIDYDKMPKSIDVQRLIANVLTSDRKAELGEFSMNAIMVGGMHFQDDYNYDIERVKRCVIHYATPDNRIIPFCAYNGGPYFREKIEKQFSIPLSEYKERA